ncbi:MAG: sialate O-acetylesterase [Planctomycetes bacterium]|nr:sialate O-acetylesterase [Planctomycetota bacterium]
MNRLLLLFVCAAPHSNAQETPVLRVFLLAGQSNMEGQAVVDLDHEQHYNGGRGTLVHLLQDPAQRARYGHLRDKDGAWAARDDVFMWYRNHHGELKKGPLSIGFAVYPGRHHFGPEMEFGHAMGDRFKGPVLLVKTAWGGKSLFKDFRPPSAGGDVGPYYEKMIAGYKEIAGTIGQHFPELANHRPVLTGMVWFQGWNDMYDDAAITGYSDNFAHLVRDVRKALNTPKLPVVIGETGNGKEVLRVEQAKAGRRDDIQPVAFVPTYAFRRPKEQSPNVGHGHHWFGNAESYLLIGRAMGDAMAKLLSSKR